VILLLYAVVNFQISLPQFKHTSDLKLILQWLHTCSKYYVTMLLQLLICSAIVWIYFVRRLRYQRIRILERKFGSDYKEFSSINYRDAQSILGQMAFLECPWTFLAGKDFAFLRVRLYLIVIGHSLGDINFYRPLPYQASPKYLSVQER